MARKVNFGAKMRQDESEEVCVIRVVLLEIQTCCIHYRPYMLPSAPLPFPESAPQKWVALIFVMARYYRNGGVSSPLEVPCHCRSGRTGKLLSRDLFRGSRDPSLLLTSASGGNGAHAIPPPPPPPYPDGSLPTPPAHMAHDPDKFW